MAKPVVSNDQIITQLTTSWASGAGFTRTWLTDTVEYSLPTTSPDGNNDEEDGFQALTANQQAHARQAFELWDELVAIDINETTGANAPITLANSSTTEDDGTYASADLEDHTSTDKEIVGEQIWFSTTWDSNQSANMRVGSYGFYTYIHEIGHALGLSHPGRYNAHDDESPTYDDDAQYSRDTRQYTVMSYFDEGSDDSGASFGTSNASTPMIDDIMAIQAKYGADMTTRTGDTVYGFNSTADRTVFDFTINNKPVFAIWDAGGTDTIDTSLFTSSQTIDLRAGHYSSIGGMTHNMGIAYNVTIENAIGGTWIDIITGNDVANKLYGMLGNDELYGLGGADTLEGAQGNDILDGGAGVDTMRGGLGNDTYHVDNKGELVLAKSGARANLIGIDVGTIWLGDKVIENANEGRDKVISTISYSLGDNVEDLELAGAAAINGSGNGLANAITGNHAANILNGGAGNDILNGMGGVDTMNGGTGDDTFYVDNEGGLVFEMAGARAFAFPIGPVLGWLGDKVVEGADGGYDTVITTVNYTLADNVEALILGGTAAINGSGNGLDNRITGNDGANILNGGLGDDQILGLGGADKLFGGVGDDLLNGGSGADQMSGGVGDDRYVVDNTGRLKFLFGGGVILLPGDEVLENADEGIDTVEASVSYTLGANVEKLTLTGPADISGFGNELANVISGNDAANLLDGMDGRDILKGFGGADIFQFSTALGAGNVDRIGDFFAANDSIQLSSSIFSELGIGELSEDAFVRGAKALDADDHIIYRAGKGILLYDANGSEAGGATRFATLGKGLDMTHADFLVV